MSREIPPRDEILHQLGSEVRASQRATDMVDELVCQLLGINRTDARALDLLDEHGRMSAGELAAQSGLTSGAITAVIDRLERAGLAHRVSDPADRRRVLVELTPKAVTGSLDLMGPLAEEGAQLSERYSDEQLELFIEFMRVGREMQERHAQRLRERLRGQR
jgi:DNA-binding MarR family transcriptional regulator